jgi:hypothetical protein
VFVPEVLDVPLQLVEFVGRAGCLACAFEPAHSRPVAVVLTLFDYRFCLVLAGADGPLGSLLQDRIDDLLDDTGTARTIRNFDGLVVQPFVEESSTIRLPVR